MSDLVGTQIVVFFHAQAHIVFSAVDPIPCGGTHTDGSGLISSSGLWAGRYDCVWFIRADVNHVIQYQVEVLRSNTYSECAKFTPLVRFYNIVYHKVKSGNQVHVRWSLMTAQFQQTSFQHQNFSFLVHVYRQYVCKKD